MRKEYDDEPLNLRFTPEGLAVLAMYLTLDGWLDPETFNRMAELAEADTREQTAEGNFRLYENDEWRRLSAEMHAAHHRAMEACGHYYQLAASTDAPRGPFYNHPDVQWLRKRREQAAQQKSEGSA